MTVTVVETKFDHTTLSVEAKLSENGLYVEAGSLTLSVQTDLSQIDEDIASLLAIRTFLVENYDVVKLSSVRDEVSQDLFNRKYINLNTECKTAVDRIIKAEGLVSAPKSLLH